MPSSLPPPPPPPSSWGPPPSAPPPLGYGYGYGPPPGWTYAAPTHAARLGRVPASFGDRLGAYLLDGLLLGVVSAVLWVPGFIFMASGWETQRALCTDVDGATYECMELTNESAVRVLGTVGVIGLGSLVLAVLYWGHFDGRRGATPGKRALNIEVVRADHGGTLGFGRGVGRYAAKALSGFLFLGYLWMLWDDNKQTWHDKIVTSVVVKTQQ